jgi:hypothetical protein
MSRLSAFVQDIWTGRLPLARIFWEYAIGYGTVLNLLATLAAFAAFSRNWPEAIGLVLFFLPAPYNLMMVVGVWRSAQHYSGPAIWPTLARARSLVWAAAATFI